MDNTYLAAAQNRLQEIEQHDAHRIPAGGDSSNDESNDQQENCRYNNHRHDKKAYDNSTHFGAIPNVSDSDAQKCVLVASSNGTGEFQYHLKKPLLEKAFKYMIYGIENLLKEKEITQEQVDVMFGLDFIPQNYKNCLKETIENSKKTGSFIIQAQGIDWQSVLNKHLLPTSFYSVHNQKKRMYYVHDEKYVGTMGKNTLDITRFTQSFQPNNIKTPNCFVVQSHIGLKDLWNGKFPQASIVITMDNKTLNQCPIMEQIRKILKVDQITINPICFFCKYAFKIPIEMLSSKHSSYRIIGGNNDPFQSINDCTQTSFVIGLSQFIPRLKTGGYCVFNVVTRLYLLVGRHLPDVYKNAKKRKFNGTMREFMTQTTNEDLQNYLSHVIAGYANFNKQKNNINESSDKKNRNLEACKKIICITKEELRKIAPLLKDIYLEPTNNQYCPSPVNTEILWSQIGNILI